MPGDARRAANGDQRAALLDEDLQLRDRARNGDRTKVRAVFSRYIRGRCRCGAVARRDRIGWEDQHLELRVQVARVERLRVHDLERKLVALEKPSNPAALDRSAIAIPQPDADGTHTSAASRQR